MLLIKNFVTFLTVLSGYKSDYNVRGVDCYFCQTVPHTGAKLERSLKLLKKFAKSQIRIKTRQKQRDNEVQRLLNLDEITRK